MLDLVKLLSTIFNHWRQVIFLNVQNCDFCKFLNFKNQILEKRRKIEKNGFQILDCHDLDTGTTKRF